MNETTAKPVARVIGRHIPEPLKEYDVWVVWSPKLGKTARAPWQSGHMYPAEWAETKPVDPRTDYDTAASVASLPTEEIHNTWPFPDDLPETVKPAVLIPPTTSGNDLLFVDFDDVREPETGLVSEEVWGLVQRLGGYAEVSSSGEGLHVWVRASLPDDYGKFIEGLDGPGQIEMYDRGRMTGGTWRHVDGTPRNGIPNAQDIVDDIVENYETEECGDCGEKHRTACLADESAECPDCGSSLYIGGGGPTREGGRSPTTNSAGRSENEYHQLRVREVADTGPFRRYRNHVSNPAPDEWQGPHPGHGGTSNSDQGSTNFNVDTDSGVWYCFAHGDGGGTLELIAILEGVVACGHSDRIHRSPLKLLETCLHARDDYGVSESADPPYEALLGVAEFADLSIADEDDGVLGKASWRLTRSLYDDLSPHTVRS